MTKRIICSLIAILMMFSLAACDQSGAPQVITGEKGEAGADGKNGADGLTPFIGENGNWWIGETDTGVKAAGADGKDGINGADGKDGINGADGKDGINGADGKDGVDGKDGKDGTDGRGILKVEILDGSLWITYTDAPDTPVNVGKLDVAESYTEDLDFLPLSDGTYGVKAGNAILLDNIVIPAIYNNRTVTQILAEGFQNAFNLKTISIPATVTTIDSTAFYGCSALESISVDEANSVYASVGNALIHTASKSLVLGCKTTVIPADGSVTSIASNAFNGCTALTSLTVPDTVTWIGANALASCSSLASLTVPFIGASASATGSNARLSYLFEGNVPSSLKTVTLTAGNAIKNSAFENCHNIETVNLPETLKQIGNTAFSGCSSLESINLPNGLTEIGASAFNGCSVLTGVDIPDTVTKVGNQAFADCFALLETYQNASYVDTWLVHTSNVISTITLREGTVGIADHAFLERINISAVTLREGLKYIGRNAFYKSAATSIQLPSTVEQIGEMAFAWCDIESISVTAGNLTFHASGNCLIESESKTLILGCKNSIIPADGSVSVIGENAFYKCSLTAIVIPEGVTRIEASAFNDCVSLSSIVLPASLTKISNGAFASCRAFAQGKIYYRGNADGWAAIPHSSSNEYFYSATVCYFSASNPSASGNYWYFDQNGVPTMW